MILKTVSHTILNAKLIKFNQVLQLSKHLINNNFKLSYKYSSSQSLQQALQQSQPTISQPYTQRAYTPSQISKQLISQLSKTPHTTILHQLNLYSSRLLPFDYDYFVESLKWLTIHQNKLSLEELLILFDLAIEYKIDNLLLQTNLQNQLYCRLFLMVKRELSQYDIDVKSQLDKTYQALEAQSDDHFNVIADKFKQFLEEQNAHEQEEINQAQQISNNQSEPQLSQSITEQKSQKITNKPIYNASQRKIKSRTLSEQALKRITHIFLDSSSRNIDFNKLLLQINTIRLDEYTTRQLETSRLSPQLTPQFLLTYTRLSINLLQLYMTEYQTAVQAATQTQPAKYTHRSVKHIYKVQAFYYYEVAKLIQDKKLLQGATDSQLGTFLELISGFPIKRRSFRKSIGQVLIDQAKRRQIPYQNLMKFFELSRFDNKLLQHFENQINGITQLPTQKKHQIQGKIQEKQAESQQKNPLVREIVDESQKQAQGVFKMPSQLFRKVTKKKSKPKNNKFSNQQSQEIDLTQPDQQAQTNADKIKNDNQDHSGSESVNNSLKEKQQIAK